MLELKNRGNAELSAERYDEAIATYTEAIALDGENHVLFSNRSAAYAMTGKYEEALKDAEETIRVNPTWPKGYSRKGSALTGLAKYTDALEAYDEGKFFRLRRITRKKTLTNYERLRKLR